MPQIAERLAGKRIAITGTTGFLGTALLERLLRTVPDSQIVLLLRAGRRSTVQQRAAREIFRNDAFDVLRAELSGTDSAPASGPSPRSSRAFADRIGRRATVFAGHAT